MRVPIGKSNFRSVITNRDSQGQSLFAYTTELKQHGCKKIHLYGLAFDDKNIDVQLETENIG